LTSNFRFHAKISFRKIDSLIGRIIIARRFRKNKFPRNNKGVKPLIRSMISSSMKKLPTKTIDTYGTISVTSAGLIGFIFLPTVQGTQNGQRTGDEIEFFKLDFSTTSYFGDAIGNVIRHIVFQIAGPAPSTPLVVSDILSPGSGSVPEVNSFIKPFYKEGGYIKVLSDVIYTLVEDSTSAVKARRGTLKPRVSKIPFFPTSVNIQNGVLYYLFISDSAILPSPAIDQVYRVHYRDV